MSKKKKGINPLLTVAAGLAVAGIYNYVKGNGVFNKRRFKNQHDAVSRYVDAHYPDSFYSPIQAVSDGWITVITTPDKRQISLSVTKCENNVYVFKETPIT